VSEPTEERVFKVGSASDAVALGSAISKSVLEDSSGVITLRAVGVSAVNQAVKAIAIARGPIGSAGMDMVIRPGFQTVVGKSGDNITAMVFRCTTQ
jgi:stage V sporulation protein S